MGNQVDRKPVVSVVIPVYNIGKYIDICLRSVLNQTFSEFEAIVVNDGSTDNSAEILRHWVERDERFVVVTTPNQGVALAREEGISRARGQYICFLDGDDVWELDMLAKMTAAINTNGGYDIVCCNYKRICPSYQTSIRESYAEELEGLEFLDAILRHVISVTIWGKLYRRWLLCSGIPHYPLRLGEDSVFNIQIGCKQPKVRFIDYVGYGYVQRPDSSNHRNFDLDYCRLFCDTVEQELRRHDDVLGGRTEFYALLNKIRWFVVYICKSSSPWIGDTEFAQHIYTLMERYQSELKTHYSRRTLWLIGMYRLRWSKPIVVLCSAMMRWYTSFMRRVAR